MRNFSSGRGRPRGGRAGDDWKVLDYLARIGIGNDIDLSELFTCLVDAWKHEESTRENLIIRRRKQTRDSVMFLFTIGPKVLAQFTVPERILHEHDPIKDYVDTRARTSPGVFSVRKPDVKNPKINNLERSMKHVNIKARVLETPKPHLVRTRFGSTAYVSNVLIADETGTIRLSLWNQQIEKVSVDDVIKIEDANVAKYRGMRQLRMGRSGTLSVIDGEGFPPLINTPS